MDRTQGARLLPLRWNNQHRPIRHMQQLVGRRPKDHPLQRRLPVAADDDHPRIPLLGRPRRSPPRAFRHHLELAVDAATLRPELRLLHHLLPEFLDRLLVFGDLAAPEPRRRVAEDDDDAVTQRLAIAAPRRAPPCRSPSRRIRRLSGPSQLLSRRCIGPAAARFALEEPGGATSGLRLKKYGTARH